MRWIYGGTAIVGLAAALLGCLWLLQGTGVVVMEPIACLGECTALTGPDANWAAAGGALMLAGIAIAWWSLRRFRRS
jgi:hypothetical protein